MFITDSTNLLASGGTMTISPKEVPSPAIKFHSESLPSISSFALSESPSSSFHPPTVNLVPFPGHEGDALSPIPPILKSPHSIKGRCFLASRDISPGEILLTCSPYSMIPDTSSKSILCASCLVVPNLNSKNMIPCSHSKTLPTCSPNTKASNDHPLPSPACQVWYCSSLCRDSDWRDYHQFECSLLSQFFFHPYTPSYDDKDNLASKTFSPNPSMTSLSARGWKPYTLDFTWLLMRVLTRHYHELTTVPSFSILSKLSQEGLPSSTPTTSFQEVWDLCSNFSSFPLETIQEFVIVAQFLTHFVTTQLFPFLSDSLQSNFLPSSNNLNSSPSPSHTLVSSLPSLTQSLLLLICKEECNSFGLYTFTYQGSTQPRQPYGLALYTSPVFFNHACCPNVGHITREGIKTKESLTDICPNSDSKSKPASNFNSNSSILAPSRGGEMIFYSLEFISKGQEACVSYIALEDSDSTLSLPSFPASSSPLPFSSDSTNLGFPPLNLPLPGIMDSLTTQVAPHWPKGHGRRDFLKRVFFFDCDCSRCNSERNLFSSSSPSPPSSSSLLKNSNNNSNPDSVDFSAAARVEVWIQSMLCLEKGCKGWFVPETVSKQGYVSPSSPMNGVKPFPPISVLKWCCEACDRIRSE